MANQPLTMWVCDICGDLIMKASDGYVVWRLADDEEFDFNIIHQSQCDPGSRTHSHSLPIEKFLGSDGLTMMLSWLAPGPALDAPPSRIRDLTEYVDFVRRLQIPYYEEARQFFADDDVREYFDDYNEYAPYLPDELRRLAERKAR